MNEKLMVAIVIRAVVATACFAFVLHLAFCR